MPRPIIDEVRVVRRYEPWTIGLPLTKRFEPCTVIGASCVPSTKRIVLVIIEEVFTALAIIELVCRVFVNTFTEERAKIFAVLAVTRLVFRLLNEAVVAWTSEVIIVPELIELVKRELTVRLPICSEPVLRLLKKREVPEACCKEREPVLKFVTFKVEAVAVAVATLAVVRVDVTRVVVTIEEAVIVEVMALVVKRVLVNVLAATKKPVLIELVTSCRAFILQAVKESVLKKFVAMV